MKINLGGNAIINLAMIGLGVVQTVLGNKKQSKDIAALKEDVVKEVLESLKKEN